MQLYYATIVSFQTIYDFQCLLWNENLPIWSILPILHILIFYSAVITICVGFGYAQNGRTSIGT